MRPRSLRFTPIAALLFVGCQFQASCGSGKTLNMERAKEFVASTLTREIGEKPTQVTCPPSVKGAKGATFECTADFGTARATVTIQQDDDQGAVTMTSITGVLISAKLEATLTETLGTKLNAHFTVDCGARVRASKPGDQFTCTAKDAQGASAAVTVVVKDDKGNVKFDMAGASPPAPDGHEAEAPPAPAPAATP